MHKAESDARRAREPVKVRWTEEETRLVARKEAELVAAGHRTVNIELVNAFPERTLEAIKGKRRNLEYKRFVQQYLEQLAGDDPKESFEDAVEDLVNDPDAATWKDPILNYIHALYPSLQAKPGMARLAELIRSMRDISDEAALDRILLFLN